MRRLLKRVSWYVLLLFTVVVIGRGLYYVVLFDLLPSCYSYRATPVEPAGTAPPVTLPSEAEIEAVHVVDPRQNCTPTLWLLVREHSVSHPPHFMLATAANEPHALYIIRDGPQRRRVVKVVIYNVPHAHHPDFLAVAAR